ncbi:MAG: T9SS type A sorting domain-containing protein [Flavobacterium sp.]|nr:T9SS type A sorting domain-containing protein [Flavobacterium sp.]
MKKLYFTLVAFIFLAVTNAQIINIPDANFKAKLLAASPNNQIAKNLAGNYFKIDINNDGEIQQSEALQTKVLNVPFSQILNLNGIEYFNKLTIFNCSTNQITILNVSSLTLLVSFDCSDNLLTSLNVNNLTSLMNLNCGINLLTNLNISALTSLKTLKCDQNQLTSLNTNGLINLEILECNDNQLTNLNLSDSIALQTFDGQNNQLTSLNVNGLVNLQKLACPFNQLTSLNLTGLSALQNVGCQNNQLNNLFLNGLTSLEYLVCNNNQLSSLNLNSSSLLQEIHCSYNLLLTLDISNNKLLTWLLCGNNQLESLFLKNGSSLSYLEIFGNQNINYICADELEIPYIQNRIDNIFPSINLTCQVNNYCSFSPGGAFYLIQGKNKFDNNNNGCDALDNPFPNMKYNITNGTNSGSLISNNSGNYSIPFQAGTHTITPVLQNPTYFYVSPTTATITFPATASPATRNFCITANGTHQDVEVTILPVTRARPGFDATYKIIYKNKGNVSVSGNVNFTYSDAETDFVSSIPAVSSQNIGTLYFDYINLLPFEKREITVVLNLNSPQEIPALVGGSRLNFEASIEPFTGDEDSGDNVFEMKQTVVNSFDPNDKTCLEGNNIAPAKVGDYVHYMIRFENTGTFPAQNIVVKDMIDTTKFDIATLIPISSSHDFVTKINGDKVEFIFENINLPFDNANNDGYVAFKIKTKSTLVLGNTFTNSANIYFDYNFPIVTNTASTTVANPLATQDFEFATYFSLYPNPVKNSLNITAKNDVVISSMSIYNTLGQLVQVITNPTNIIDVSELKTGNYFVKIVSDKGTSGSKFIKE